MLQSTLAPFRLPTTALYRTQIVALTSHIVELYGTLCGVVLSLSFRVLGSLFIQTFHAQRHERQTVVLKVG